MADVARTERARLTACLKKLSGLKLSDLARDDLAGVNLSFRSGLPYIEKTLRLFRDVARSDLRRVPSDGIAIIAGHGERALAQFDEMRRFNVEKVGNPDRVRNDLLAALRDSYRAIHDDVSLIIARRSGQHEVSSKPSRYAGVPLAVSMFVVLAAAIFATYHYGMLEYATQNLLDQLRSMRPQ